jgi:hypothetical protein
MGGNRSSKFIFYGEDQMQSSGEIKTESEILVVVNPIAGRLFVRQASKV